MSNKNMPQRAGWLLFILFSLIYLVLAFFANTSFTQGRFCLHMDELLTLDGVREILHAPGQKEFLTAVMEGSTHCYGRILWNISAVFSFIPEKIWGLQGQIIATRMLQALLLLGAYWILIKTFIRTDLLRAIALLILFAIPSTSYYAALPKPEPLQLFWMALFFYFAVRKSFGFDWHWLFLGFALGTKISALPWIPVLGLLAMGTNPFRFFANQKNRISFVKAISSFLAAFLISEPWILTRGIKGFPLWFAAAMQNARHGSDDASINWKSWVGFILDDWTPLPAPFVFGLGILAILLILAVLWNFSGEDLRRWHLEPSHGLVLIVLGSIHLLLILFGVKRIWGFYLHPGTVFLTVGLLSMIEAELLMRGRTFWLAAILCAGMIFAGTMTVGQNITNFLTLARRDQTAAFKAKYQEYQSVVKSLETISKNLGRPFSVFYDPRIYVPDSNEKYTIKNFPGPFLYWFAGWDLVILSEELIPEAPLPLPTNSEYAAHVLSRQAFGQHVSPIGTSCKNQPCYSEIPFLLPTIHFYARQDIALTIKTD